MNNNVRLKENNTSFIITTILLVLVIIFLIYFLFIKNGKSQNNLELNQITTTIESKNNKSFLVSGYNIKLPDKFEYFGNNNQGQIILSKEKQMVIILDIINESFEQTQEEIDIYKSEFESNNAIINSQNINNSWITFDLTLNDIPAYYAITKISDTMILSFLIYDLSKVSRNYAFETAEEMTSSCQINKDSAVYNTSNRKNLLTNSFDPNSIIKE